MCLGKAGVTGPGVKLVKMREMCPQTERYTAVSQKHVDLQILIDCPDRSRQKYLIWTSLVSRQKWPTLAAQRQGPHDLAVTCLSVICPQRTALPLLPDARSLPQIFREPMHASAMLIIPVSFSPFVNLVRLEGRACPVAIWTEALTMQNARREADRYLLYPYCTLHACTNYIQET